MALAAPVAAGQFQSSDSVPGWYNSQTQIFTPEVQPPLAAAAKPVKVKGTLILKATVSLDAIPAGQKVFAFPVISLFDDVYRNGVGASQVTVTRSGNTGTVSISFPYLFTALLASESILVEISFSTQQPPSFPFAQISKSIPLPADGATTVVTLPSAL